MSDELPKCACGPMCGGVPGPHPYICRVANRVVRPAVASDDPLRKGDRIGPFRYGGDMDTGEGDPFGLRGEVFDVLSQQVAEQLVFQGMCAHPYTTAGGERVLCLKDKPCPIHEPARQVSFFDKFVRWFRR